MSLPTRERGLKYLRRTLCISCRMSLPTRERGLKYFGSIAEEPVIFVAPHAGAWIEIELDLMSQLRSAGRSPRGSVD